MDTPKKSYASSDSRKRYREVQRQPDFYQDVEFDKNDVVYLSPFYPSGIHGKGIQRGGESDQFVICRHVPVGEELLHVKDTHAIKRKSSKTYTVKRSQVTGHMKMETHLREKSFNYNSKNDDRSSLEPPSISPSKTSSSNSRRDEEEGEKLNKSEHKQHLQFKEDIIKDSTAMQSIRSECSDAVSHYKDTDEDNMSDDSDLEEDVYPFAVVSKKNSKIARSTLERQNQTL